MKLGGYLIWTAVSIGVGIFVLLGYFIDHPTVQGFRLIFLQWAVILSAVAMILGLINLIAVHLNKVSLQEPNWVYSAVLVFAFLWTIGLGLFFGPDNPDVMLRLFNYLQLPVEAGLMALLAVSLVLAGVRMMIERQDVFNVVFMVTALIVLLGSGPWLVGGQGMLNTSVGWLRAWISQVLAIGGARGILLGVALGAITTGLRVLLGVDRPYGD